MRRDSSAGPHPRSTTLVALPTPSLARRSKTESMVGAEIGPHISEPVCAIG